MIAAHSERPPLKHGQSAKSTRKNEFHPCAVFSARALLRHGRHTKRDFALSGAFQ